MFIHLDRNDEGMLPTPGRETAKAVVQGVPLSIAGTAPEDQRGLSVHCG